jgi:hypothetical protein
MIIFHPIYSTQKNICRKASSTIKKQHPSAAAFVSPLFNKKPA